LEHLREGRKINAIKVYREDTGVDLKAAKEAVEKLQRDHLPEGAASIEPTSGCLGALLLAAASVIAALVVA